MTKKPTCWNCAEPVEKATIFCPACNKIQASSDINHFERLGVTRTYELGEKNLEVAYFAQQRKLHPDLFINKSEKEKSYSMAHTMDLNAAYEALKSPLKRAEYLLLLEGVIVNQDNRTSVKPSQELLMESMEAREELSGAESPESLRKIAIRTADQRISCIDDIKGYLSAKEFKEAAQEVIRLRYLEKLNEEIRQASVARVQ